MNNLLSEEEIIYIATDFLGKVGFFPDVTAILFQLHLHVAGVLLCF